ncbi:uncharacterized protein CC84DRAFT_360740 [Paraphaeosphaeria sporulosa]|uniref:MARVEL domain-containing protein n=1 Tax=Paraphaeosphaeria sporulosa TaxID=1460663 RepID=A0A177BZK7_9PLEO|nr:uncharacterized protein CC84DRAFT_360740 [Paraphaeosphaeria sporulosa]OAG00149.1 hypothetical protein CC84DRAFT_360740 [Paraphaeosphaeria sporulosa]
MNASATIRSAYVRASMMLEFQARLIVLFSSAIFMFAGIVDFPRIISKESPLFASIVFGPQVIHGFLFLFANAMLAISEQHKWYIPKISDPDWLGAFLNATGGFWFMMAGFFFFQKDELAAAAAAMVGSWAFLVRSLVRWYVVMEFC